MSMADLMQAKKALSERLLSGGVRPEMMATTGAVRLELAIAQSLSNVHAIGIGHKITKGRETKTMCVRLHVTRKLPKSLIPPVALLPERMDGVHTDVVESAPAFLLAARVKSRRTARLAAAACTEERQKRQRPVVGGISAAHHSSTAGTIACFCRSRRAGDDREAVFVLSNNHVLANVNQAQIGDAILQPGPIDGGTPRDRIARLHRFERIDLSGGPNVIDAAIASLDSSLASSPEICSVGRITGQAPATVNLRVRKHGRTTGYTEGLVTDISYDAVIGMDHANPNIRAIFNEQIRIAVAPPYRAFGLGGDSGSLVANGQRQAVGLFFAGPPSGDYGVANHIAEVLNRLEVAIM